jgi:hypothetical protein
MSLSNETVQPEVDVYITNLKNQTKQYIQQHHPKIYILTPCFGSTVMVDYVVCLNQTVELFREIGLDFKIEFCKSDSLVTRARNNLVARAMYDHHMTHVMFIDNDISWEPFSILKLLLSEKKLIGGVYPLKHYHWERLLHDPLNPYNTNVVPEWIQVKNSDSLLKNMITDVERIQSKLLKYNLNYLENFINIDQNLTKVRHVATGFLLIQRTVFETMAREYPATKYVDDVSFLRPEENQYAYALFECGVEEGHYFSEDWGFCSRWNKLNGDVWIDVSIQLNHTGIETFRGTYISSLI